MSSKESIDRAHRIKAEQEKLVAALSDDDLYNQLRRKVLDVFTHKEKPSAMIIPVDYEHDDDCYVSLRLQELKRRWQAQSAEVTRQSARIKLIEGAAKAVCDDASYDEERDVCDVSVPPMEHLQNVLDHNEIFPVSGIQNPGCDPGMDLNAERKAIADMPDREGNSPVDGSPDPCADGHDFVKRSDGTAKCADCPEQVDVSETGAARSGRVGDKQ